MRLEQAPQRTQSRERRGAGASQRGDSGAWRGTRVGPATTIRLALLRMTHGRALLAAVALGMLVAVTLICTVPLFNSLVLDTQLQQQLIATDPQQRNVQAVVDSAQVSQQTHNQVAALVPQLGAQYLGAFTESQPTSYSVSDALILRSAGSNVYDPVRGPQARLQEWDYTRTLPHMRLLSGNVPQAASSGSVIQVLITQEMAQDAGLKVGSQVVLWQFGNHSNQVTGQVTGIWQPKDVTDAYWNGASFSAGGTVTAPKQYPILITESDYYRILSGFNGMAGAQNWIFYSVPAQINGGNLHAVGQDMGLFRSRLSGQAQAISGVADVGVISRLDTVITGLEGQQSLLALPLYVVVAQVIGLALLFVVAMAGLLIEGQAGEIATLKSRGASGSQLLGVFLTQGVLLGIFSAVAGALLAAALALALVRAFIPPSVLSSLAVGPSYLAQLARPQTVIVPAVIGALLGVGAIGFAALQTARLDVLAFRREQGRQARPPFWARMYLDVALAVLCAVGYLELGQFGGTGTRAQLPGGASSPLLLLAPALLLLAGALLTLRLAPLAARAGQRLAARGRGLSAMLALAQVERTPGKYLRITLLLTLAVGLGIFAISYNASLARNVSDSAAYTVGASLRIQQRFSEQQDFATRLQTIYASQPGVKLVTPVYRTQASTTADQGSESLGLLAVDPATFGQVVNPTSWRSDYASSSLSQLMAQLQSKSAANTGATEPAWAIVSESFASQYQLHVDDRFALTLDENPFGSTPFVVGAIVNDFPTLYPNQYPAGFIVLNLKDFDQAVKAGNSTGGQIPGPNEFWALGDGVAAHERALSNYLENHPEFDAQGVLSLRAQLEQAQANPVSAGMRGLLLVGAVMAALLAVLGAVVQSALAARQRSTQFAVLRTLGVGNRELIQILLTEQSVVYIFGLVGGTVLGALLVSATLPFLQFSDRPVDVTLLGIPPYVLVTNPLWLGAFYATLVVAFVVALVIAARYAATVGLGRALRLGED